MAGMTFAGEKIFSADQVRSLDQRAIHELGIPGYTLMCRAGQALLETVAEAFPGARRLLVVCGAGNNAGDGYVLARLARRSEYQVRVMSLGEATDLSGDARTAYNDWLEDGGTLSAWDSSGLADCDLVVDAILGSGLQRPLQGIFKLAVEAINASLRPVLAVDIPSGLNANTGSVMGAAIKADLTLTFVGRKLGFYLGSGPDCAGRRLFADLQIPPGLLEESDYLARLIPADICREMLGPRPRTAHKGDNGHVLVVGGGEGMAGAVRLAAEAALRSGAGLVTVATLPEHVPIVLSGRPEIMCKGVRKEKELQVLLDKADIVVAGPGLGQDDWSRQMYQAALSSGLPLVLDADALNLLAEVPVRREQWVLTPHPGEAARLLGTTVGIVQNDRLSSVQRIAESYGGVAVLKGAGTMVARAGEHAWVCDRGNPGMAAPGMGDVLAGVIAGLAAQCRDLDLATRLAVMAHASAGDIAAAQGGERGLLAGDLMLPLRAWLNGPDIGSL
ncbi:MAG: NAD(P)H-hydrate dehydratase [Gammaproteobacteria bacterium]|nr:NAD(P)H-hydrate dehydratase [Gammaproteobacteria bacterium]